ncbi:LysR family transcriptional regulator [Neptunomonas japonica]|uniref:LysR family transcriptional regulator n=1 Tax=Neptunomonas japonica JAMM 1380 TaxID=1441457 RepID=A0A7R6PV59_9GAMM|nr:LysR family transcriptional regulator [Neptunomonas japonica]BBB31115.1 LysR family transcriptional regulator [Neptunomonas japonica JAMM 1380]
MKKNDYMSIDGNNLLVFITVMEELSVTKSAIRLGVTQSAVSHTLDKLRSALGDQLFVRSGRSIVPTEQAHELLGRAEAILDGLKGLTDQRYFDPSVGEMAFKVAANDFTRSLIFPRITRALYELSISARIAFTPAGVPDLTGLRGSHYDLAITPFPPEGADIFQVRLFSDTLMCFYDGKIREAPKTKPELLHSNYLDVIFEDHNSVMKSVLSGKELVEMPKPQISVPNFDALSDFILGTDLITVQLAQMAQGSLSGLDRAPLPFKTRKFPVYMVWHRRNNMDPAHIWFRQLIKDTCGELIEHIL